MAKYLDPGSQNTLGLKRESNHGFEGSSEANPITVSISFENIGAIVTAMHVRIAGGGVWGD